MASWIEGSALKTEAVGLNPVHGKVVFSELPFFFLLLLSPPCQHSHNASWPMNSGFTTVGDVKTELTWKNPSSAIRGGETLK